MGHFHLFLFSHGGCTCPEGFKGKHCEIVEGLQFDTPDVETPGGTTSIFIPPENEETTSAPEENDSADSEAPVMVDEDPITPAFDDDNTDSSQNGWVKFDSESTKKEQKAVHIVGLSFAILALVLFPVFLLVMRRTLRREKQNLARRTPTDLNLEPDGGTMPAPKSDDSTTDNSASTGMEGESVEGSENATIV